MIPRTHLVPHHAPITQQLCILAEGCMDALAPDGEIGAIETATGLDLMNEPAHVCCRTPSLLSVHLKRFQQDMRGRLSKISGHIPFGFDLDLRPFLEPADLAAPQVCQVHADPLLHPHRRICMLTLTLVITCWAWQP